MTRAVSPKLLARRKVEYTAEQRGAISLRRRVHRSVRRCHFNNGQMKIPDALRFRTTGYIPFGYFGPPNVAEREY
jgi:hypothetical protein